MSNRSNRLLPFFRRLRNHPAHYVGQHWRGILSTFFKYSFQRGWSAENPIPKVPHYRIRRKRGVAQTFTAEQAAKLMEHMKTYDGGR